VVSGTLADAVRAAKAMDAELQPAYGVDVYETTEVERDERRDYQAGEEGPYYRDGEEVASVDGDTIEVEEEPLREAAKTLAAEVSLRWPDCGGPTATREMGACT
jgi:hypothetical protein